MIDRIGDSSRDNAVPAWSEQGNESDRVPFSAVTSRSVGGVPDGFDGQLIEDAVDVLRDASRWRLVPERWRPVQAAVETLFESLAAGNVEAFRSAVYELEAAGPVRALGFGEIAPVAVPADLADQVVELIYSLDDRVIPAPED
jgi:hypothetical protein